MFVVLRFLVLEMAPAVRNEWALVLSGVELTGGELFRRVFKVRGS